MGLPGIEKFTRLCKKIGSKRTREELLKEGSSYLNRYNPEKFSREIIGKVFNEVLEEGDEVMKRVSFLEEMAREDGLEKGREEERKKNALKMLEKGIDIATICECTELSKSEVEALKTEKKAA